MVTCSLLRRKFEQERKNGLTFKTALDFYNAVRGSLEAHKMELAELRAQGNQVEARHLEQHIQDGEALVHQIENLTLG